MAYFQAAAVFCQLLWDKCNSYSLGLDILDLHFFPKSTTFATPMGLVFL